MSELFEKASRLKLVFTTTSGLLAVDDLWELPLTSIRGTCLDNIARALNKELKASADESFVEKPAKPNEELQLKFEIVKHIIDVRLAENAAAKTAADKREQKQKLLGLIAEKREDGLKSKSLEELEAMVAAL